MAAYCVYQDRCHQEIDHKLNSFQLIPEAKDEIILYLIRENFLNEERFAKSFARGKFYQKKWGRVKISMELKKRWINERLIQTALQEINEDDYRNTLKKLYQQKFESLQDSKNYIKHHKSVRFLMQKGYEYALINEWIVDENS
ncbi:MAG: regulatory protein RecX [Flavobacteriaceae bacterium]|nr:regulatory protein RecX [Flavobacteriaceae bacterium]